MELRRWHSRELTIDGRASPVRICEDRRKIKGARVTAKMLLSSVLYGRMEPSNARTENTDCKNLSPHGSFSTPPTYMITRFQSF